MTNFLVNNPPILQNFLNRFIGVFSKPTFISFSIYTGGLFLQLKRTNMQSITFNTINAHYENIQYFLSKSKWNEQEFNDIRIQILQSNRTTKSSKKGVLVIDDSGCKKWGYKTEGVAVQHYGTENIQTRCNVVVVSAYSVRILMHDGQRFNTMVDNVLIMMDTNLKTFKKAIILV